MKGSFKKDEVMMKADIKEEWVKKLESGDYEQARSRWGGKNRGYCCLQLLRMQVLGLGETQIGCYESELEAAGLTGSQRKQLIHMNDTELKTFPEIAQWVRENVPVSP